MATVYCLFFENYMYIGITEDFPFERWSNHFSKKGSFVGAIKKVLPEFDYKVQHIKIISLTLEDEFINGQKELQAIEKSLHNSFDCNPFIKKVGFSVISSTTRTAPRGFNYEAIRKKTDKVRDKIESLF
ncbi:hypothetical protein V6237_13850 [Pseudoalteromonas carrageenovora]|uniref:hypothetical protein n=1 Tax=Pseudoalteromonas carrageenovora TaxID=227 RepID=UPI00311D4F51